MSGSAVAGMKLTGPSAFFLPRAAGAALLSDWGASALWRGKVAMPKTTAVRGSSRLRLIERAQLLRVRIMGLGGLGDGLPHFLEELGHERNGVILFARLREGLDGHIAAVAARLHEVDEPLGVHWGGAFLAPQPLFDLPIDRGRPPGSHVHIRVRRHV